jgi:hypothetical protein
MEKIKAKIYIAKSGKELIRKIFIYVNGAEFQREFYTKKSLRDMIDFLKYNQIQLKLTHVNYNCSYIDLPF